LDDALVFWRAREVHRVQCFFYGLGCLLLLMDWLVLTHVLGGVWGTLMVAFHVVVFWGLWRVLCWVVGWFLRRTSAMYRWIALAWIALVLMAFLVPGCYPMAVEMNRRVGLDCSQAALQQNQGRCVATSKKGE
jgi:hypothetical protein